MSTYSNNISIAYDSNVNTIVVSGSPYTVPSGKYFKGQVALNGTTSLNINGNAYYFASVAVMPFVLGAGSIISIIGGTGYVSGALFRNTP